MQGALTLIIPYLIILFPIPTTYLGLVATLYLLKLRGVFKRDKVVIATVILVVSAYLVGFVSGLLAYFNFGFLVYLANIFLTFFVAYLVAKNFLQLEQRKAINFGVIYLITTIVISILLAAVLFGILYALGMTYFNFN